MCRIASQRLYQTPPLPHPIPGFGDKALPHLQNLAMFYAIANVEDILTMRPDVILTGIEMPGANGVEAIRLLKKKVPQVEILVQTVFEDDG